MSTTMIQKDEQQLIECWDNVLSVPNTHKVHLVMPDGPHHILVASVFKAPKYSQVKIFENEMEISESENEISLIDDADKIEVRPQQDKYFAVYFTDPMSFFHRSSDNLRMCMFIHCCQSHQHEVPEG